MAVREPSQPSGIAWNLSEELTPNWYYPKVCQAVSNAPETNPIQSGPAHGRKTKELHPTMVVIPNPRPRIISSFGRVVNLPFALAEVIQILGGINDPQALKYYNSKIIEVQGDIPVDGTESDVTRFNAAYGERVRRAGPYTIWNRSNTTIDQLEHVISALKKDPNSRQASIVIGDAFWDNVSIETKDRACNVYAHAMIRDGKLDWMQIMRSNDIIWGLPYNLTQWGHVQEYVATQLNVPIGQYTLVQDSLHVYEDFYTECAEVEHCDMYQYMGQDDLFPMRSTIESVVHWEKRVRQNGPFPLTRERMTDYWTEVIAVFNAYKIFKERAEYEAQIFKYMPYCFELRWPLMRWFCSVRWLKDDKYNPLYTACLNDLVDHGWPSDKAVRWLYGK
jgi:thymidylate synthase